MSWVPMTAEGSLEVVEKFHPIYALLKMIKEDIFFLFLYLHSELVACLVSSWILITYSSITKTVVTACDGFVNNVKPTFHKSN